MFNMIVSIHLYIYKYIIQVFPFFISLEPHLLHFGCHPFMSSNQGSEYALCRRSCRLYPKGWELEPGCWLGRGQWLSHRMDICW